MPQFLAVTSRGLHKALLDEMQIKNFKGLKKTASGVLFSGSWRECYRANMLLRCTPRILKPVLDFAAYNKDDFYFNAKKHDFTKYIAPKKSIAVQTSVQGSVFTDQRYPSLLLKDVVVDQFQESFGQRPSVDKDNPDLSLFVKVYNSKVSISLDTSGFSLSQRGFREESTFAPIKEHLAAAVLQLSSWTPGEAIYDPMCGTGTFLIEAAKWQEPRLENFGFTKWKTFQKENYEKLKQDLQNNLQACDQVLLASDISDRSLQACLSNFQKAKTRYKLNAFSMNYLNLNHEKLKHRLEAPLPETGLVIMNPPYDKRLKVNQDLKQFYDSIVLKTAELFPNWRLSLLAPEDFNERSMQCTVDSTAHFESGGLKIKLLRFPNLKRFV